MKPYDGNNQQQIADVSDILKSKIPSLSKTSDSKKSFMNKLPNEHDDFINNNEHPEKIMIYVPYSSPVSSEHDEEEDKTTESDDDYTSVPFSISVYNNNDKEHLKNEDEILLSKAEAKNKTQFSQKFVHQRCTCKCKCSGSISKAPKTVYETKCVPTSTAIPSSEFNFPIPKSRLRTDRSEDCFGNVQKIKLGRSISAQSFRSNNSKTHYSTFRPQSAISPTASAKRLTVPKILNIQPDNIFKEHTLPVGKQTMKTLQYINKLHRKEMILREEKSKQHCSSMVVLSEDLNDLCIKPLVMTRPQSAHPVMNSSQRRWEKSEGKLLHSYHHQEYRLSRKEKLKKDIDHVAQLNCSNDRDYYLQGPNSSFHSFTKGKQRISSSVRCKKCSKPNKILQKVQFEQNI